MLKIKSKSGKTDNGGGKMFVMKKTPLKSQQCTA